MKNIIALALLALASISSPTYSFFGYEVCYDESTDECSCKNGCHYCR